ncbi:hypothetical protein AHF37_09763 [Paragonimus kellicotti]|nr:hypothetical protein AHF37_09763 [Paragonimus kellicotti]
MDFVQSKFSCCGVQSAADYGMKGVPRSCGIYTSQNSGCHKVLVDTCKSNLSLICGIGITFRSYNDCRDGLFNDALLCSTRDQLNSSDERTVPNAFENQDSAVHTINRFGIN